jgi:hypothetical protein
MKKLRFKGSNETFTWFYSFLFCKLLCFLPCVKYNLNVNFDKNKDQSVEKGALTPYK